jgi:hypothetical protein
MLTKIILFLTNEDTLHKMYLNLNEVMLKKLIHLVFWLGVTIGSLFLLICGYIYLMIQ